MSRRCKYSEGAATPGRGHSARRKRQEIARTAASARWDNELPMADYEGNFNLGDRPISCAVCQRQAIVTQASLRSLGRSRSPKADRSFEYRRRSAFFLQADTLRPFISDDLLESTTPIFYRTKNGGKGMRYDATLLPTVAEVYLKFGMQCWRKEGSSKAIRSYHQRGRYSDESPGQRRHHRSYR